MASDLVLLTGGTGHVGYRTLIEALSKGYKVRAAVRSESKIAELKGAKSTQQYVGNLSFVIVPNIEVAGAFDEAVKGVDYIVHIASPLALPSPNPERDIIQPAINGTLSILNSALKEPSIKRVVITSSVAAVAKSTGEVFTADNVEPDPTGPYSDTFSAYAASKRLAYNRTRDFINEKKPQFTIVNVMPSFVIGKNELATTPEAVNSGSNRLAFISLLGGQNPAGTPAFVAHVDDVAYVHIAALDPKIEGNQNFGVNWNGLGNVEWDSANEIVRQHFPAAVENGVFPLGGSHKAHHPKFDASRTEEVLGVKFKSWEDMIVNLAGHYLDVAGKA